MSKHSKHLEEGTPQSGIAEPVATEENLAAAESRAREAENAALRATAELQNLKRRQREEMDRLQDTATKQLVLALLPVVDDLERALDAAATSPQPDALRDGVNLTLTKLLAALGTVGVQKMPGVGEPFNPESHEAVMQTNPSAQYPNGTISQELRAGYTQHGHVIRPSLVAVAHE